MPDERFKEWFVEWELRGDNSIPNYPPAEASYEIVNWQEKMHYIDDSTGMCAGLSSFPLQAAVPHPQPARADRGRRRARPGRGLASCT